MIRRRINLHLYSIRSYSSTTSPKQWIARQSSDPFVKQAALLNYRSRASFKLQELQSRHNLIQSRTDFVLDLGSAPGGWTQVATQYSDHVFAVDIMPMDPVSGSVFLQGDMLDPDVQESLIAMVLENKSQTSNDAHSDTFEPNNSNGKLDPYTRQHSNLKVMDVVLSDMAHPFTGNKVADVIRLQRLCETALLVADRILKPGGSFVCKFLRGKGNEGMIFIIMKRNFNITLSKELRSSLESKFQKILFDKPVSSRSESAEGYFIGLDFLSTATSSTADIMIQSSDSPAQLKNKSQVPHWTELKKGTRVLINVERIGKHGKCVFEEGDIDMILSRENHVKVPTRKGLSVGVKVLLSNGKIGKVVAKI